MRSILYLIFSVFISAGSGFLVQLYLAKKLSVYDYGVYTSIINLVNLIAPIVAFGIASFLLRAYSEEGNHASRWMKNVIQTLILTTTLAFMILQSWSYYKNGFEFYFIVYCLFFIYMVSISYNSFTTLKYQLEENYKLLSLWQLAPKLLMLISLVLVLTIKKPSIYNVAMGYGISGILVIIMSVKSLKQMTKAELKLKTPDGFILTNDHINIFGLLKNSYPYGLSGLFYLIYYQSDILILSYYLDYIEVGYYGFSLVFVTAVCLIPSVYYLTFRLKKIHALAAIDRTALKNTYKLHIKYSLIIGVSFFFIFVICIKPFITIVFDDKYEPALYIIYSLAAYIPIKFLTLNSDSIMHTKGLVEIKVRIMGIAALLNVLINFITIPSLGAMGAVTATIMTELFLLLAFHITLSRKL
ncbi:oligosaccharide flippase family protein [uncultured Psychrobacter sp.]|uniref:oligosaccharide flippase family protein n=1 Tax=uncultured Psychrobacter sp. TaxID=259303 RepID=UPI002626FCB2|nr:oligosaccharide flippase family protein [uncultured Psychrobacter sp.]